MSRTGLAIAYACAWDGLDGATKAHILAFNVAVAAARAGKADSALLSGQTRYAASHSAAQGPRARLPVDGSVDREQRRRASGVERVAEAVSVVAAHKVRAQQLIREVERAAAING